MFWKKKNQPKIEVQKIPETIVHPIDFTKEASVEEVETVSVIASAIMAGDQLDSSIKIKSVRTVDHDKEVAALVVASVMAQSHADSVFKLVSIREEIVC